MFLQSHILLGLWVLDFLSVKIFLLQLSRKTSFLIKVKILFPSCCNTALIYFRGPIFGYFKLRCSCWISVMTTKRFHHFVGIHAQQWITLGGKPKKNPLKKSFSNYMSMLITEQFKRKNNETPNDQTLTI